MWLNNLLPPIVAHYLRPIKIVRDGLWGMVYGFLNVDPDFPFFCFTDGLPVLLADYNLYLSYYETKS